MAFNLKPMADRIIVRRESADDKSAGGIVLPDSAKNKPQRGTVLAVGPGKLKPDGTRATMQLKAGDRVLFTSWAGDEFQDRKAAKADGEILVMHEGDVMCVLVTASDRAGTEAPVGDPVAEKKAATAPSDGGKAKGLKFVETEIGPSGFGDTEQFKHPKK